MSKVVRYGLVTPSLVLKREHAQRPWAVRSSRERAKGRDREFEECSMDVEISYLWA